MQAWLSRMYSFPLYCCYIKFNLISGTYLMVHSCAFTSVLLEQVRVLRLVLVCGCVWPWTQQMNECEYLSTTVCCDISSSGLCVCVRACVRACVCVSQYGIVCVCLRKWSHHWPKQTITSKCICSLKPSNEVDWAALSVLGWSFWRAALISHAMHINDALNMQQHAAVKIKTLTTRWSLEVRYVLLSVSRQITGEKAH